MPLHLSLRPGERIIINGCVLKNGPRRQTLEIENRADVLRGEEMLEEATARTPARRIAYQIQIALVSHAHRADLLPQITEGLEALARALPRFAAPIAEAETCLQAQNFYGAFRALSAVIRHEDTLFARFSPEQSL
ncbi:flagellar biosynthesis repressor FlbT [Falsigemmobacter faecalis]|nr:flagellar biosynthesis repressor FlbT [Falsigemmobacter faecalis]